MGRLLKQFDPLLTTHIPVLRPDAVTAVVCHEQAELESLAVGSLQVQAQGIVEWRRLVLAFRVVPTEGPEGDAVVGGQLGQLGEGFRVAPLERGEGFVFKDEVKGGTIPGQFIPAVEKGVLQAMAEGAVAGYPLQDIEVTVYDGAAEAGGLLRTGVPRFRLPLEALDRDIRRIVELGTRRQIFENPQHPYTQALMKAVPIADPRQRKSEKDLNFKPIPSPIQATYDLRDASPWELIRDALACLFVQIASRFVG